MQGNSCTCHLLTHQYWVTLRASAKEPSQTCTLQTCSLSVRLLQTLPVLSHGCVLLSSTVWGVLLDDQSWELFAAYWARDGLLCFRWHLFKHAAVCQFFVRLCVYKEAEKNSSYKEIKINQHKKKILYFHALYTEFLVNKNQTFTMKAVFLCIPYGAAGNGIP